MCPDIGLRLFEIRGILDVEIAGWLWMSTNGYFALVRICVGTTSVDFGSYSSKSIFCALPNKLAKQVRKITKNRFRFMIFNIESLI